MGVLGLMLVVGFRAFGLEALGIVGFDVRFGLSSCSGVGLGLHGEFD